MAGARSPPAIVCRHRIGEKHTRSGELRHGDGRKLFAGAIVCQKCGAPRPAHVSGFAIWRGQYHDCETTHRHTTAAAFATAVKKTACTHRLSNKHIKA